MAMAYTRGFVDRDTAKNDLISFVAATEGRKGDRIDLRMDGADLSRFQANPVILHGHMSYGSSLPIGRAHNVRVDGKRLLMDIEFDANDEVAQKIERKYRDGFMNAVSIGFDVTQWERADQNHWKGGVATKWELFETSTVPVPMDSSAVAVSRDYNNFREQFLADLEPMVRKILKDVEDELAPTKFDGASILSAFGDNK